MTMRLGIDIEQISRLQRKMEQTPQFAAKLFTAGERDYCDGFAESAPHYAARFCAKEAFRKAVNQPVDWLDIEVINEPSGKPIIRVHRKALDMIAGCSAEVSLSHAGDYATSAVIIWSDGNRQAS